ncbi:cytochrome c/FTR1 family iron permease [Duganella callida]|uniref:C-type cytochrome n=1 Tax=Duganella callida TaxID=2561932 RepID=A0A4Y9SU85_9BURK|nr:cytochrome c/FTR1 family iron permease [Duganella callida]TFW29037.1 c-type cytochrome [Duganella callida]
MKFLKLIAILTWLFAAGLAAAQSPAPAADAKQLWQLLDYVSVDYGGAVAKGEVLSQSEYAEMRDFTENAGKQARALPPTAAQGQIIQAVDAVRAAVARKADITEVARLAKQANALIVTAYAIPLAPRSTPDITKGATIYAATCAACHGATGDGNGPLAAKLEPKPIAFKDAERAGARSVMALYQVISHGVEGTSMASYASLPEDDRWALAFFVGGLSHDAAMRKHGEQLWNGGKAKRLFPDLTAITTTTQAAAAETLGADDARDLTAYLRAYPGAVEQGKLSGLGLSRLRLKESLQALHAGDRANATRLGLSAYLDGFEPIEPMVSARNPTLMTAVEDAMLAYRSAVSQGDAPKAEAAAVRLEQLFTQVDNVVGDHKADPMTTFAGAATILLREGVEALLIVIGMIAFLKKARRPDALRYVHGGWISALAAGALTWGVATYLVDISGASRELTEGLGGIFAAVVLLSVGLWMHQKSAAGRWQAYLESKLTAILSRRSAWGLFGLAFVAVYREVFETVLFYSAIAADGNNGALAGGFVAAVVLLGVIAWVLLRTSARMPLAKFFSWTSVLIAVLAVVLVGKGTAALQEAGWLSVSPLLIPRIDWLGINPTIQTTLSQVVVALVALFGFSMNRASARKARP